MLRRSCSDSFLDLPQQTNRTTSTHFRIYEMAPKKQEKKDLESVYTFKQMFSNLPPPPGSNRGGILLGVSTMLDISKSKTVSVAQHQNPTMAQCCHGVLEGFCPFVRWCFAKCLRQREVAPISQWQQFCAKDWPQLSLFA
jgi:hypothetical protein